MYPFNLPLSAPACCWVSFRLSKYRLSNSLSQHQTPKQNYSSQLEKISIYPKENEPEVFLHTYLQYQSCLQCHFCIPNHLVTRPAIKRRAWPLWKNFFPPEKMSWTYCMHNHCFRCYMLCNALLRDINVKFGPASENCSSPWCPKLVTGLLVTVALWLLPVMPLISVFSQSNFSGLTSNFNRRN